MLAYRRRDAPGCSGAILSLCFSLLRPAGAAPAAALWHGYGMLGKLTRCHSTAGEMQPLAGTSSRSRVLVPLCTTSSLWGCLFKINFYFHILWVLFCLMRLVIFFTLGNLRSWGACVHANLWTKERKKTNQQRNLSKLILEKQCTKNGCRHFN